jgi:hypothetical protein
MGTLALAGLAACAPAAMARVSATATPTTPLLLIDTPTPDLALTPTDVPAGWTVLYSLWFSLAYPLDWTVQIPSQKDGSVLYVLNSPDGQADVRVAVHLNVPDPTIGRPYCLPASADVQYTTLAGLPMTYMLSGDGLRDRTWTFANAQRTVFTLDAGDAQSSGAIQTQDDTILATFTPDNANPWSC